MASRGLTALTLSRMTITRAVAATMDRRACRTSPRSAAVPPSTRTGAGAAKMRRAAGAARDPPQRSGVYRLILRSHVRIIGTRIPGCRRERSQHLHRIRPGVSQRPRLLGRLNHADLLLPAWAVCWLLATCAASECALVCWDADYWHDGSWPHGAIHSTVTLYY